jgi:hypothetical protein
LLKIKIKFVHIILRSFQTAVFGPPGSRSVCQRYRSGSGFGSGFSDLGPFIIKKEKNKKNLDFYCFLLFCDILALKNDVNVVMYLQKKQKKYFFGIVKVTDENSRIRIWIRKSVVRIRKSGSGPKWHGSGTLPDRIEFSERD